jgi:signal transduction histidine kinase
MKPLPLVALSAIGLAGVAWLVWAFGRTAPPPAPVMIADMIAIVGCLVGPWLVVVGRRLVRDLGGEREAALLYSRALVVVAILAIGGPIAGVTVGSALIDTPGVAAGLGVLPILAATLIALVGTIVLPWTHLMARTLARERAARVRAEERADVAAHLHDTVLQALTLIQKRTDEPATVGRLARRTERELRAWLYGAPPAEGDDFAGAVSSLAEEVEDQFNVTVELGTVGTCRLDPPTRAMVGAIREALTNAAKHSGAPRISAYAEVAAAEVLAIVRDRGRGFDPSVHSRHNCRGIAESIEARLRHHDGRATIRSAPGEGTEVELRLPRGSLA